jgi:hypothetical protein
MTVVRGTAIDAGGSPVEGKRIYVSLVTSGPSAPGYTASGEIVGTGTTETAADGTWSFDLEPNAGITPANTYYRITMVNSSATIVAPPSGGPYEISEVLAVPPPTPAAPGLAGIAVSADGVVAGTSGAINFRSSSVITVTAEDDPYDNRIDVTINSGGGTVLLAENNLSEVEDFGVARANMGLGGAAVLDVGTGAGTVAAGNDARITGALPASALGVAGGAASLDVSGHLTAGQDANLLKVSQLGQASGPAVLDGSAHLPVAQGGTGSGTAQAAIDVLTGSQSAGKVLRSDGTHATLSVIQAADLPAATGTTQGAVKLKPWQFDVSAYGAVGDLNCVVDGAMNLSAVLTSAAGKFVPGDVGKAIAVKGALTSGVTTLVTTVASYQSATQVTLSAAATVTSGTGLQVVWGTDDTAHIQAAINAAQAFTSPFGVATQVLLNRAPGGFGYMIAGPLLFTDGVNSVYNSQLTIGVRSDRLPPQTLEFIGPSDAGTTRHWNQDYPTFTGATLFSTGVFSSQAAQATSDTHSVSNGGNPSCLGGPTGKFGYGVSATNPVFNNVTVVLRNMSIMNVHSSSGWSYSPFNFHGMARAHLEQCSFGTSGVVQYYTGGGGSGGNTDFANPATFSGGASIGGLMPAAGNNASCRVQDCVWNGGYTYGPLLTEHTVCVGLNTSLYSWIGVGIAGNYGDGGTGAGSLHGVELGQFCIEACSYHLAVWGTGASGIGPYVRGRIDTEGTVQIRGNLNNTANLQALMGEIELCGSPSTPTFTFPSGLHILKQTQARGPVASPSYVLGTAQINAFYRDADVTISGGTVTGVKVSALAGGGSAPTMTTLTGVISGTFRVPAGCWWEIDGSVQPTSMQWVLD